MTDPFASYAVCAAPVRSRAKPAKPKSQLDLKMEEKQRLSKAYRIARRRIARETLAAEPRLRAFARYLKSCRDGAELVDAIAESWLPTACQDVKHYALKLITARLDRLDREAGFVPLDDPLPPASSTFFRVREVLGAR